MPKLFIDIGHGGTDSGANGNGVKEADINLKVGLKLRDLLVKQGVEIKLSRTGDTTLSLLDRTKMANSWRPDALISIHCNSAANSTAQGLETFCYKLSLQDMAKCVQDAIIKDNLYTKNRGVKEANFHVLRESYCRACLVELAFVSNTQDASLLKTKQNEFALAIAKGICNYFGIEFKEDKPVDNNSSKIMYRVCIGSFEDRQNALDCVEEAKRKGYPAFITAYEKTNQ